MNNAKNILDHLMNTTEAAEYLGTTREVLAVYRCKGIKKDLPYFKDGRAVRYLKSTLDKYIAAHTMQVVTRI